MTATMKDVIRYADMTARGRKSKWMDSAILLHALCCMPGNEAHRILRAGGFEPPDMAGYLDRSDNEPLEEGGAPRFTPRMSRLMSDADSPLGLLRALQHEDCAANRILREHGVFPPRREPTGRQVERAARAILTNVYRYGYARGAADGAVDLAQEFRRTTPGFQALVLAGMASRAQNQKFRLYDAIRDGWVERNADTSYDEGHAPTLGEMLAELDVD